MKYPLIYKNPQLDGSTFYWRAGEDAVLCLHGFTATTVEVRTIASFFRQNGYSTYGPLLPGHGTTPQDANKTSFKDWIDEATKAYLFLKENHRYVFVLGESMGGLLALYLCSEFNEIKGAMVFAPALRIPKLVLSKLLWPFKEYRYKKISDDDMPWQGYDVVPLKAAANLFDFQKIVRKKLPSINQPVIIFQGKKDQTIDPMSSVYALENIGSTDKELVWLDESSHVILLDTQVAEVEEICLDFIRHRIHANPEA